MKHTNEIKGNKNFDDILNGASKLDKAFISMSLQISTQIISILQNKNMLQKDFAEKMGKTEAEISKWLSGFHNFTIKTIATIEAKLGETIIITPNQISSITNSSATLIIYKNPPVDYKILLDTGSKVQQTSATKVISMPKTAELTFKEVEYTDNKESYEPTGTYEY